MKTKQKKSRSSPVAQQVKDPEFSLPGPRFLLGGELKTQTGTFPKLFAQQKKKKEKKNSKETEGK